METIKELLKPELIWFLVGLVLLLMEFALPGLIIFFFGVGAWIVALVCLVTDVSLNIQLLIFIVASVLSLVCLRKWLKAIFLGHTKGLQDMTQELSEFIGERAMVREKITPHVAGKVELHGTDWMARAEQDIEVGAPVEVVAKDNLTLTVKPV
jgi:membrane protein implicated in regulation of membrane protease activity